MWTRDVMPAPAIARGIADRRGDVAAQRVFGQRELTAPEPPEDGAQAVLQAVDRVLGTDTLASRDGREIRPIGEDQATEDGERIGGRGHHGGEVSSRDGSYARKIGAPPRPEQACPSSSRSTTLRSMPGAIAMISSFAASSLPGRRLI